MNGSYLNKTKLRITTLLLTAAAALLVSAAARSVRQETARPVQGTPEQGIISYYTSTELSSQETETEREKNSSETGPAASETYTVTVYRGHIGVFRGEETEPCLTSAVNVYLLPEEDIAILRRGIAVKSLSQARAVLEDYE